MHYHNYERRLLDMIIEDMSADYDFPHDKRLVNYIYSTWNRYDLALRLLQRPDWFDPYNLNSELEITDRQIKNCLAEMIAEGWVEHCGGCDLCHYRKTRIKYKCIRAGKPMRDFWSGFSDWWFRKQEHYQISSKVVTRLKKV